MVEKFFKLTLNCYDKELQRQGRIGDLADQLNVIWEKERAVPVYIGEMRNYFEVTGFSVVFMRTEDVHG